MDTKKIVIDLLQENISILSKEELTKVLERPKLDHQGDWAFPCFILSKIWKKPPHLIANELVEEIQSNNFSKIVADGPYLNFFLNKKIVSASIIGEVLEKNENYGTYQTGKGKVITIDYSSPNIAKPFSMGHLRSTVIGNSIANLAEKNGYHVIRINHLGDWGTQFGKLIVAYKKWGNEKKVQNQPIKELLHLYVKFHEEANQTTALEDEAREWFKKLEDNDQEAITLWKWFREESVKEFEKIYQLLDVRFDSYHGEAFYNDKMEEVIKEMEKKEILESSDGADVISLNQYDLPPCLIRKSDGATLYATRDLAAAIYRKRNYSFDQSFYIVGHEQSLHFQQIKLVLKKMGYSWFEALEHISFGFILKDGKKMSTRKGRVILLEEVINEAIELAEKSINEKNPGLSNKKEVAKEVGVGAIIFHDLKNEKQNNVEFSLQDMLRFEGTTGPYVQYTHARACSILTKADSFEWDVNDIMGLDDSYSWPVIMKLAQFPENVERGFLKRDPSKLAKYVLELAQEFNKYYSQTKILTQDDELFSRLALVKAVTMVLKEGLRLLGIKAPNKM
ncbi:arginyl-tRNA synthetase [Bacillus sp. TS-2]|nr:arginyl-tRNA synthetase [Bacillus sp. TS-2]